MEPDLMPAKQQKRTAPVTLRKWRLFRGLTLEQVGDILNVGPQTVHKWETGKTPVDIEKLRLLAKVYATSPDALLFDPADDGLVARLRTAHEVLRALKPEDAERWLSVGQVMARKPDELEKD